MEHTKMGLCVCVLLYTYEIKMLCKFYFGTDDMEGTVMKHTQHNIEWWEAAEKISSSVALHTHTQREIVHQQQDISGSQQTAWLIYRIYTLNSKFVQTQQLVFSSRILYVAVSSLLLLVVVMLFQLECLKAAPKRRNLKRKMYAEPVLALKNSCCEHWVPSAVLCFPFNRWFHFCALCVQLLVRPPRRPAGLSGQRATPTNPLYFYALSLTLIPFEPWTRLSYEMFLV